MTVFQPERGRAGIMTWFCLVLPPQKRVRNWLGEGVNHEVMNIEKANVKLGYGSIVSKP